MGRKTFSIFKRAAIWRAHNCRCIYCTELVEFPDLDIDHIIPECLKEKPEQLSNLLKDYELNNFDIEGTLNLVPSHRKCNLQKKGQILPKNRALHFLSIAESKYDKVSKIELELKAQAKKDKFTILLHVALDEGHFSLEQLTSFLTYYNKSRNIFEVLSAFPFVDSELKGFLSSTDIDSLYDRPILPRLHGLDKLNMGRKTSNDEEKIEVKTCRKWVEAVRDGYYALTTYDIKEEMYFRRVYALVIALAKARVAKYSFITEQKVSIANFDLLPVAILPALSGDDIEELKCFQSEGVHIRDLIEQGKVKVVASSPLSLTLHYNNMDIYLNEILRADLNDDGIEDLLLGIYSWALEGTFGTGETVALTRLGIDQPFTTSENIELNVSEFL